MEIYDNILNFLSMENTGALLIVGAWGSGKTYYIDNEVFRKLGEGDKPRQCIRVSLFGVKDTADIPYRVFQAFTNQEVSDRTKGVIDFDTEANDITLDGRSRASYGKGNRSIITCAVNFALMDYCMQKERPFSRLLVYDSPLCTKYGKSSSDRATDNVLDAYAKYCNDKEWPYQVIIFDNKIDSDPENINKELYPNIHFVELGTEERPGLFIVMGDDGLKEEANVDISLF